MFPDIVVADGKLLPELHVNVHDGLGVKFSEHQFFTVIARLNEQLHPFGLAGAFVLNLNLDVVALFVF